MNNTINQAKDLFESIMVLCVEGPEVCKRMDLINIILKESIKGYDLCKTALRKKG